MPIMNGIESCEMIREYERMKSWAAINIIIVTANCSVEQSKICMGKDGKIKAVAVFKKPFSFSDCKIFITDNEKSLRSQKAMSRLELNNLQSKNVSNFGANVNDF